MEKTYHCDYRFSSEDQKKQAELENIRALNESIDMQVKDWFEESERIFKRYGL